MNHPEPTSQLASMEAILESVAQPVWVVDHDGFVVFVNPAGLAALGYDELSELRGRFGHDAIHYKHRDGSPYPAEDCPMTKVRGTGESVQMDEDWFVRRDGSMFPVSYTSTPIEMADGPGVVVAFKDIEEQREAEQALREREAILATVGQPVWVTDFHGRFHYANPAALAALGFSELSELVGQPAHDTVHYKYPDGSPFPEEDCPLVQARKAGATLRDTEDWLVRKDGSIVRVTYSSAPFELPDGLGSVTAFSDVEEQRRAEEAARERDVAQARAEELRVARRRIIEAADAARASSSATCTTAPSSSSSAPCSSCSWPSAGRSPIRRGRGSCARRRSSWRAPASTSCGGWPRASTRRSSPTAASARRSSPLPRGCRFR